MSLVAATLAIGCSSDPAPSAVDGGDAGDAAVDAEGGSVCPGGSATCGAGGDCAQAMGGVAGCWICLGGCCLAVPGSTDPSNACNGDSACVTSACDGNGSCTGQSTSPDGTPCGTTCGGLFVYQRSSCRAGVCVGEASSQKACTDRCYGEYTQCAECPPTGCGAACDPSPGHKDLCWP